MNKIFLSKELYNHGIFSDDTIADIKENYARNKENDKHILFACIKKDDLEI